MGATFSIRHTCGNQGSPITASEDNESRCYRWGWIPRSQRRARDAAHLGCPVFDLRRGAPVRGPGVAGRRCRPPPRPQHRSPRRCGVQRPRPRLPAAPRLVPGDLQRAGVRLARHLALDHPSEQLLRRVQELRRPCGRRPVLEAQRGRPGESVAQHLARRSARASRDDRVRDPQLHQQQRGRRPDEHRRVHRGAAARRGGDGLAPGPGELGRLPGARRLHGESAAEHHPGLARNPCRL